MKAQPNALGSVTLVTGPESLLAERAVRSVIQAALAEDPQASVSRVSAAGLDRGTLVEITGGSLLASTAIAVLDDLADLPADLADDVVAFAERPIPELALVLVHDGGVKGRALLDRLRKAKVQVAEAATVKAWELPQFAITEARRCGGKLDPATAALLVDAVGSDLRSLAAAIGQLLADTADGVISQTEVRRYFAGRAEVTSFAVADDVMAGNPEGALGKLRWALSTGVAPVLVTSALAGSLRSLGRYLEVRDGRRTDADLARQVGVPPWKLKDLARQSRDWSARGVAAGLQRVALADAQVKGAGSDAGFALEQLVLAVIGHRGRG